MHSDPPHRPELIERYSLGWCNGPAGGAQVFRLLALVTGDSVWTDLGDRCWRTVTRSGLPSRIRPGFWDNNGRCCGTAGVLALACDRIVERDDDFRFADELVDDLTTRATVDEVGARWSNYEHRATPPDVEPLPRWAMRASFASCSGTPESSTAVSTATRSSGPTIPPLLPTRRPTKPADRNRIAMGDKQVGPSTHWVVNTTAGRALVSVQGHSRWGAADASWTRCGLRRCPRRPCRGVP